MSRLPGQPLGATPVTSKQVAALAEALDRLHAAVPVAEAETLAPAAGHPVHGLAPTRRLLDTHPGVQDEPTITEALIAARRWLHSADAERTADLDAAPSVFGREDHNLPNFLIHDDQVLLVDFEDSGRSDRSTELATLIEHQGARCTPDANWEPLLAANDRRLRDARRYYAAWWLAVMLPGQRGYRHNSPEARRTQAGRTLTLLA